VAGPRIDDKSPDTLARLRGLLDVSRLVRSEADLTTVLADLARIVKDSLGYRVVVINLYRPAWDDYYVAAVEGDPEAKRALLGATYGQNAWESILDPRFERRGAYLIWAGDMDWAEMGTRWIPPTGANTDPEAWQPEDELFVPLWHSDGHLLGVMSVGEPPSGKRPSDEELDVLVAVAGHAALAVQQGQEASEAAHYQRALEQLLRVSTTLADRSSPLDEQLQTVCDGIGSALGFQRVALALLDRETGRMISKAAAGWSLDDPMLQADYRIADVKPLFDPAFAVAGCYLLPSEVASRRIPDHVATYASESNGRGPHAWAHHWLLVPLHDSAGDVIGLIWADDPLDRLVPSAARLQALRTFANHAATAIESHQRESTAHDMRQRLLKRVVEVAEGERTRLAGDLHDGPIQRLSALTYGLEVAKRAASRGEWERCATALDSAERTLEGEIGHLRRLMSDLRPPVLDQRGLSPALVDLAAEVQARSGMTVTATPTGEAAGGLSDEGETALYRIAQEALTNAAKHGRAERAWVSLSSADGLVELEIGDDGCGFDPKTAGQGDGHFGLITMMERAQMAGGTFTIRSAPGQGTMVKVMLDARTARAGHPVANGVDGAD
jgi:signal transduction histidine kinase